MKSVVFPSCYRWIKPREGRPSRDVLLEVYSVDDIISRGIFVCSEELYASEDSNNTTRLYYAFLGGYKEFETWRPLDRSFHEVIFGIQPQKLRVDIDIGIYDVDLHDMLSCVNKAAITAINVLWNVEIDANSIITTTSSGPTTNGYKHSYHLIIHGYYVTDHRQIAKFLEIVANDHVMAVYRDYIDCTVAKDIQQFRIFGCSKPVRAGVEPRVKRWHGAAPGNELSDCSPDDWSIQSTLITDTTDCVDLTNRYRGESVDIHVAALITISRGMREGLHGLCVAAGFEGYHEYESTRGNRHKYKRLQPSYCNCCERVHTHDNTLVIKTVRAGFVVTAWEKCYKSNVENRLGTFVGDDAGVEPAVVDGAVVAPRGLAVAVDKQPVLNDRGYIAVARQQGTLCYYDEPTLRDFEINPVTLCVLAGMKMGKTKKLIKYIEQKFPDRTINDPITGEPAVVGPRIMFISFRQAFSDNIKGRFDDFVMYNDPSMPAELTNRKLIVQVESLHRVVVDRRHRPDLLILDESESIFEQFNSGLGRSPHDSWAKFEWLMKYSGTVVCMDAMLGDRTVNALRFLRTEAADFEHTDKTIYIHANVFCNAREDAYEITETREVFHAKLYGDLTAGKRVCVATSSKAEAELIFSNIRFKFPDLMAVLYSSDTEKSIKRQHLGDVNGCWTGYDVIVYTPTISAGVSFEMTHFDRVYGWFTDDSCTVETCIQMLGRIRDVGDRRYVIGLSTNPASLPETAAEVRQNIIDNRTALYAVANGVVPFSYDYGANGDLRFHTSPFALLWFENTAATNRSKNNFVGRFISYVKTYGATCHVLRGDEFSPGELAGIRKEDGVVSKMLKSKENDEIASARTINGETYNDYTKVKLGGGELTRPQELSMRKWELVDYYKYGGVVDEVFVREYNNVVHKRWFRNLRRLYKFAPADTTDGLTAAVEAIRREEQAEYDVVERSKDRSIEINDVAKMYSFNKHRYALGLLALLGFSGLHDRTVVAAYSVVKRFLERRNASIMELTEAYRVLKIRRVDFATAIPPGPMPVENETLVAQYIVTAINRCLFVMYGAEVKWCRVTHVFRLESSGLFGMKKGDPRPNFMP
jgi:hypothetical protein